MNNRTKLILTLLFFTTLLSAQDNDNWDLLLNDVKVKYVYSPKYEALICKPKFGEKLEALDQEIVSVKGFFIPADMGDSVVILSHSPSNMCFFCSGAGIESIVEIHPMVEERWRFGHLNTDNYYEAKGKLKLNYDDYDHLIYILEDAELVKIIKD